MNDAPTTQAKRVAFYVDGYNLYHSINNIVKNNPGLNYLKWLDLRKLFTLSPRTAIWLPPLPWRKGYARDSSIC